MKRTYTKPLIAMESFQLDAAIAQSCSSQGYIPIGKSPSDCSFDGEFFNQNNCQVDLTGADDDGHDTICYHGPEAAAGMTFVAS